MDSQNRRIAALEAALAACQAPVAAGFDWQPAETKPTPYRVVLMQVDRDRYTTGHWAADATAGPAWIGFAGNQSPPYYRIEDGLVRRWCYIQAAASLEAAEGEAEPMRLQTQKPSETVGAAYDRLDIETNGCPVLVIAADGSILEISQVNGYFEIRGVDKSGGSDQLVIMPHSPNTVMVKVANYWEVNDGQ